MPHPPHASPQRADAPPCDALVVGAGPAGCAAAIGLVRQGLRVLLVDAARFPRDKVCGDVLLPEARQSLDVLGFDLATLRPLQELTRCRFFAPSGQLADLPFVDLDGVVQPWWVVPRLRFDALLVAHARACGVEVQEGLRGVAVVVEQGAITGAQLRDESGATHTLRARVVVAADGAASALARAAGLFQRAPEHLSVALRGYADLDVPAGRDALTIYASARTLPGCGWVVPVGEGHSNVGVGVLRSDLARHGLSIRAMLDDAARCHPELAAVRAHAQALHGWSLPGASLPQRRVTSGLVAIGDAGGMVDPFTGHGIHTALRAGLLASQVLARALANHDVGVDALQPLERAWQREFGLEMRLGHLLQRAIASPWRVEQLVARLQHSAPLRRLAGGLIGHAFPRRALLSPRILRPWLAPAPRPAEAA